MSRSAEEAFQAQFALVQEQSDLTDARETSRVAAVIKANSERMEATDTLIYDTLTKGLGLQASGSDLDDVVAQWPDFEPRREASYAQGACLTLVREDSSTQQVMQPGAVFAAANGQKVVTTGEIVFLSGSLVYPASGQGRGWIVATIAGPAGRIGANALRTIVKAPDWLVSCNNPVDVSGGQERETDEQLRKRFLDYLAGGISRMPERGLIALAKAFRDEGVRHATVWVDPTRPYAELRLDNGRGFSGMTQPARVTTGVVPVNGLRELWVDGPVVESEITIRVNGEYVSPVQWVTLHERGRVWIDEAATFLQPGDVWEVRGHTIYVGILAKIQSIVEGLQSWAARQWGYRSVSARVRVVPTRVETVEYDLLVVYEEDVDRDLVDQSIRDVIVAFHDDLEADTPLLMLRIKGQLDRVSGAKNIHLRDRDDTSVEMSDVYPTPGYKLGTWPGLIRINRT